jgi:hypothetical protein
MKSLWNPNRFLRSIQRWYWGNPQPGKVFSRRMQARCFTSTSNRRRKVHFHRITLLKSRP